MGHAFPQETHSTTCGSLSVFALKGTAKTKRAVVESIPALDRDWFALPDKEKAGQTELLFATLSMNNISVWLTRRISLSTGIMANMFLGGQSYVNPVFLLIDAYVIC